jgi:glycosyltransferase involved in cell wall biosynthesis
MAIALLVVGDGPARGELEQLAASLGVTARFMGSCYDEEELARYFHVADLTVYPADIGLTAIHSLAYGVPVLTHNRMESHGPEAEAIIPGQTGDFFQFDDVADITAMMVDWLRRAPRGRDRRCAEIVDERYSPQYQRRRIEEVLDRLLRPAPTVRVQHEATHQSV